MNTTTTTTTSTSTTITNKRRQRRRRRNLILFVALTPVVVICWLSIYINSNSINNATTNTKTTKTNTTRRTTNTFVVVVPPPSSSKPSTAINNSEEEVLTNASSKKERLGGGVVDDDDDEINYFLQQKKQVQAVEEEESPSSFPNFLLPEDNNENELNEQEEGEEEDGDDHEDESSLLLSSSASASAAAESKTEDEEVKEVVAVVEKESTASYDDIIEKNNILASKILINKDYSLLLEKESSSSNHNNNSKSNSREIQFEPGKLTIENKAEVLGHCYTNPDIYHKHFHEEWFMVAWSERYNLLYIVVPKSGSSTARLMLKTRFGYNRRMVTASKLQRGPLFRNYTTFTFIREPLSRFFSGFEEAYMREAPWNKNRQWGDKQVTPKYLYDGIQTWNQLTDVWCPPSTRTNREECYDGRKPAGNGTMAARLERYVHEEDLLIPFNVHLQLQVPLLSNRKTGLKLRVDEVYDKTDEGWYYIAGRSGIDLDEPDKNNKTGVVHSRAGMKKVDLNFVSNSTKQKICEFALIDYCCLNIPLPPPCQNLYCRLNQVAIGGNGKQRLQIQPWSFPNNILSS